MTNKEAIKGLKALSKEFSGYKPNEEMFDMAIKALEQKPYEKFESAKDHIYKLAGDYKCWDNRLTKDEAVELCHILEQQPCEDTISRQAAIDALHMHLMYRMGTDSNKKRLDEWINNLPSAQPEVIRCTECKHYREYDSEFVENDVVVQCMADRFPISETIPDGWFCAGAERKDDE